MVTFLRQSVPHLHVALALLIGLTVSVADDGMWCMQISDYSVWLIVAVTCERYLVVCHPFRASTFCGTPVARRLVLGLLLAFLGLNSHFFWTVGVMRYCLHGELHYQCTAADSNYVVLVTVQLTSFQLGMRLSFTFVNV